MYTHQQWVTLSERFNNQSFTGKLILIKTNPQIFKLEYDDWGNFWLRLVDQEAMKSEVDMFFQFPQNLSFTEMRDLFKLLDLNLFPAP